MNKHKERKICRLCLKKCDHFEAIEEVTKEILDVLLLRLDLDVSEAPVMCTKCAQNIKTMFDFKSICLHTQDYVVPFINPDENTKLDLRQIFMNNDKNENIYENNYYNVCGICMDLVKTGFFTSLDNLDELGILHRVILEECLPELDLSATKEPVICVSCNESLQNYFGFVTNCLKMEENIKRYCEVEGTNGMKVNLNSILQFMMRNMLCAEEDGNKVSAVAFEEHRIDEENTNVEVEIDESENFIKIEEHENLSCNTQEIKRHMNLQDVKSFQMYVTLPQPDISIKLSERQNSSIQQSPHSPSRITTYKSENCLVKVKSKINVKKYDKDGGKTILYKCQSCTFRTKYKRNLKNHILTHKNASVITMFQCQSCSFQTKRKYCLQTHGLIHKNISEIAIYPCQYCSYQTRYKGNLKKHMPKHYSCSEVNVYQCKSCSFKTKSNNAIRTHVLKHKSPSEATIVHRQFEGHMLKDTTHKNSDIRINPIEIRIYLCGFCSYQTKYEANLKKHMLRCNHQLTKYIHKCDQAQYKGNLKTHKLKHKNEAKICETKYTGVSKPMPKYRNCTERTVYQCTSCSYQTRYKGILKKHILQNIVNHKKSLDLCKNPLKITMYQCKTCPLQTKYKGNLKRHMRKYVGHSKRHMYQCKSCLYNTEYDRIFKKHMLIHTIHSKKSYQCESCLYRTKDRGNLKEHMHKHHIHSEITMYQCDCCLFRTKYKNDLQTHKLTHKSIPDVTTYQCKFCSYRTKYETILKKHMLKNMTTHKHTYKRKKSAEENYQCEFCLYRTKYKGVLKKHMLKHGGERTQKGMYRCDSCSFQTKHKNVLQAHELMHKDPSEITMYQCENCSYQSKYKGNLKKHTMIHGKQQ